jgi:site-specific DNA-cytosine methylase
MPTLIDTFSGLGGWSEAFIRDSEYSVYRFDNNPLLADVPNTIITDDMFQNVADFSAENPIDILLGSPPCTEFSHGFESPISRRRRGVPGYENFIPSTDLVEDFIALRDFVEPRFWAMENVIGSIKWLKPILGEPTQIIGSQVLWGNFPFIHMPAGWKENKAGKDTWSTDPLRANKRAIIPYEISMRLKIAIETQPTLELWV